MQGKQGKLEKQVVEESSLELDWRKEKPELGSFPSQALGSPLRKQSGGVTEVL